MLGLELLVTPKDTAETTLVLDKCPYCSPLLVLALKSRQNLQWHKKGLRTYRRKSFHIKVPKTGLEPALP